MTLDPSFLQAIFADPDADTPRLVSADWLEERGDPLGEFLRLQIALEPLRRPRSDPREELERVRQLHQIPPGKGDPDEDWPLARQLCREAELLREHKAAWLGEAARVEADVRTRFQPEFRRGFVASAAVGLEALLKHGAEVRRACPGLRRLVVFGMRGRGEELASCAALAGLPELVLADWPTPYDADDLFDSPHLAGLHSLTVWEDPDPTNLGSPALARLPGLRELALVQMWGGVWAKEPRALNRRATWNAELIREARPGLHVRLERPFTRRFPLDGVHIGHPFHAGSLPDGHPVLVEAAKQPFVIHFDTEGRFLREERLDLPAEVVDPDAPSWEEYDVQKLLKVLRRDIGFRPGPIFVREFWAGQARLGLQCWGIHETELASPSTVDPGKAEEVGARLYGWWNTGMFVLLSGISHWVDELGQIRKS